MIPVTTGECFTLPDPYYPHRRYWPLVTEEGDVAALFTVDATPEYWWVDARPLWSREHRRAPYLCVNRAESHKFGMALNHALMPFGFIYYEMPRGE